MPSKHAKSNAFGQPICGISWASGMENIHTTQFSPYCMEPARIDTVKVSKDAVTVNLADARTLHASIVDFGPVFHAPKKMQQNLQVVDNRTAVFWPDLDYKVTLSQMFGVE